MKSIQEIIETKERLDKEIAVAASTMELNDTLFKLKQQMKENQRECPHDGGTQYNFVWVDDTCPYCGKKHAMG